MTYKKLEKEINEFIKNENNVPDSVLDTARITMANNQTNFKPKKSILLNMKFYMPILTSLILIAIITISIKILDIYYKNDSNQSDIYNYVDLNKLETESIEYYNIVEGTSYLYLTMTNITESYILADGQTIIGLEEHSTYDQYVIEEYIIIDFKENIDVLTQFVLNNSTFINEFVFSYTYDSNEAVANTIYQGSSYYLKITSAESKLDQDSFRQVLTNLIESRQN